MKNLTVITRSLLLSLMVSPMVLSAEEATADEENVTGFNTITVTAQKREAIAQDVPMGITALNEDGLEAAGIDSIQDLGAAVAGLEIVNSQPGRNNIVIRGISDQSPSLQKSSTVGYYVDEIPLTSFPGWMAELAMFDVERVEVLRGPQGTLFGDGSMGGTLRIITAKPDSELFSAKMTGTISSIDEGGTNYSMKGMINVPLIEDTLALRATVSQRDMGGWLDNTITGETNTNDTSAQDARIAMRWTPSDKLTIDLSYYDMTLELDDTFSSDENYQKDTVIAEVSETDNQLSTLTVAYDFGDFILVSATGSLEMESDVTLDMTSAFLYYDLGGTNIQSNTAGQDTFTQELRLTSINNDIFEWTVGAYYKTDERALSMYSEVDIPDFGGVVATNLFALTFDIKSYAVFGDVTYHLSDDIDINFGARYFEDERSYTSTLAFDGYTLPLPFDPSVVKDDAISPRLTVSWDLSDDVMTFATVSKGFRSGGINSNASEINAFAIEPCATPPGASCEPGPVGIGSYRPIEGNAVALDFDAESLINYEVGIKTMLLDNSLMLNAYAFYQDYSDLQTLLAQPVFEPGFIGNLGYTTNVGEAVSKGMELELKAMVSDNVEAGFNFAYIDATITADVPSGDRPLVDDAAGGYGEIIYFDEVFAKKGNRIPFTPELSTSAYVQYFFPLFDGIDGNVRLNYNHRGDSFSNANNSDQTKTASLDMFGLRISIEGDFWWAQLFADNLTNSSDATFTDQRNGHDWSNRSRPRTIGLQFGFNYE